MAKETKHKLINRTITRRDFMNTTLLGSGAALLSMSAPGYTNERPVPTLTQGVSKYWYGYGGIGDYARSHGNNPEVVNTAHNLRDGMYEDDGELEIIDLDEGYDLVVVGAGMAGLGAAYEFSKTARDPDKCLMIENHPIFGGESKRNEFLVDGHLLIGPQGANGFSAPSNDDALKYPNATTDVKYMVELGISTDFTYAKLENSEKDIRLAHDSYGFQYWQEDITSVGYYLGKGEDGKSKWSIDPIDHEYSDMDGSEQDKQDLSNWRTFNFETPDQPDFDAWLDSITYKQYVEDYLGFSPYVTRHADVILAGSVGLGSDALSANCARGLGMPIKGGNTVQESTSGPSNWTRHSFPGGNDGFSRHFVKKIIPNGIEGDYNYNDIMNGKVNFSELDNPNNKIRMRLRATVVKVEHDDENVENSKGVYVTYSKGNKTYRLKANKLVMATGGWVNKYVVRDLPEDIYEAYSNFNHVPFLIANVAVNNWRFMEKLGISSSVWRDGIFGNSCNVRLPMTVGDYQPVIDPDKPALVTFYVPFYYPGLDLVEQGMRGRAELFSTSYAEYEEKICSQMTELFGESGFDPDKDIEGIVLNRWGHAYVTPQPGFFFGVDGDPAPSDVIRKGFGRVAFAHSELQGMQHWGPAADEGQRAVRQLGKHS
ncbi:NAD(P)-binding protein [Emcibacteraceae bacterium]|nr:NAD(P)-binding protein [Emcibacteraceae bacterium]MDA9771082.1 NAD(P)-binding protein [Emcibacteraceae bacterium]